MATLAHALHAPPAPLAIMCASLTERLLTAADLDDADARRLLASARRLRHATRDGAPVWLLKGRHLAIAGAADSLFELAATRLGARVSRIDVELLLGESPQATAAAARMLPRLYDALECAALSAECALALHRRSGVPVYLGLGGAGHPIRGLLREIAHDREAAPDDDLALLMQAVLVETLT